MCAASCQLSPMPMLSLDETASCACGAVSLRIKGPVLSMLVCSCLDCRKSTGTGHSAVVLMSTDSVAASGKMKGHTRTAASGAEITRNFCPKCGTPLFAKTARAPLLTLLPVGLFDQPDWFSPRQAIFSRTHLDWDTLDEALPRYDTYRDNGGF
ncbi:GFA family protein [Pelagibacterium flavum]|uniref:GFA family protein n=1 Tax=Pelagibacterium flavum TaxID=2984530 RepID=A0ABY6IWW2_9HYPH|nr:GFA family protein [Pelagibacterium sp. YIM 151497]UYQ73777.1 GFA family protein [Pelagibacterium sp. YIM 151497]